MENQITKNQQADKTKKISPIGWAKILFAAVMFAVLIVYTIGGGGKY